MRLDAASYPHIIDLIIEETCWRYNASNWRLVSKEWKERTEKHLAKHLELFVYNWSKDKNNPRSGFTTVYTVQSVLQPPIAFMGSFDAPDGEIIIQDGRPRSELFAGCQLLDIDDELQQLCLTFDFGNTHTVRVRDWTSFEFCLHQCPVPKLIFMNTVFDEYKIDEYKIYPTTPTGLCDPQVCATPELHTQKIVLNQICCLGSEEPWRPDPYAAPALEELVIIFHPWSDDDELSVLLDEIDFPLGMPATFAVWGLAKGVKVTVVNISQLAFHTNQPVQSQWVGTKYTTQAEFNKMILQQQHLYAPEGIEIDPKAARFLTTDEYIAEIGLEEFKFESGPRFRHTESGIIEC